MTKKIAIICMTVLLVAVAGCRSHKQLTDNNGVQRPVSSNPSAIESEKQTLDTILNARYSHYCANFSCSVENISLNGQIRIVHDSCIWISIYKIIEVGRIMITPSRVSGYARILNKYYDGSYADVHKRWGIDLDYATLEALLVGNCPPNCTRSKEPERNGNTVTLCYNQKGKSQRKVTLLKELSSKLLTSTEIAQSSPATKIRCNYSNRTASGGQMLPTTIDVNIGLKGIAKQTQLTISRITLNQPQNTPFKIPSKLEKL